MFKKELRIRKGLAKEKLKYCTVSSNSNRNKRSMERKLENKESN